MGLVDIVIETGLQPYDVQALIPLIEAAGGVDHELAGRPVRRGRRRARLRRSRRCTPRCCANACRGVENFSFSAARAFSAVISSTRRSRAAMTVTIFTRGRSAASVGRSRRRADRRSRPAHRAGTRRARRAARGTRSSTRSGYVPRVVGASATSARVARRRATCSCRRCRSTRTPSGPGIDERTPWRRSTILRPKTGPEALRRTEGRVRGRGHRAHFGERATHVRPGLIVGPFDAHRPLRLLGRALRASALARRAGRRSAVVPAPPSGTDAGHRRARSRGVDARPRRARRRRDVQRRAVPQGTGRWAISSTRWCAAAPRRPRRRGSTTRRCSRTASTPWVGPAAVASAERARQRAAS